MTSPVHPVSPHGPLGPSRVIQGSFPGGRPGLPRAVPQRPRSVSGAAGPAIQPSIQPGRIGPVLPAGRARPILPKSAGTGTVPALAPPRPTAPQAIAPATPRPAAAQPSGGDAFALPPGFQLRPSALGRRLPEAVQQKMEAFFGASFADVRVHVGHEAASIGALAFTIGSDLYFAPGQYNPQTMQGQQLLGHELTHVVQQRAGRVRNPMGSGVAVVQDPALEAEAERMGMRAATCSTPIQARPAAIGPCGESLPSGSPARSPARPKPARMIPAGTAIQPRGRVPGPVSPLPAGYPGSPQAPSRGHRAIQPAAAPPTANRTRTGRANNPAPSRPPVPIVAPARRPEARSGVVQRIKMEEALAQLNPDEILVFKEWLKARSPGAGPEPKYTAEIAEMLLINPFANVAGLRDILKVFEKHRSAAKSHGAEYEDEVALKLHKTLSSSALLLKHVKRQLSLENVKAALAFLTDDDFQIAHYKAGLSLNPELDRSSPAFVGDLKLWDFRLGHARKIDETLAFEHGGRIHLRRGAANMHIAIHELIHMIAHPGLASSVGPILNEALTETIARWVCADAGITLGDEYYATERQVLNALLKMYSMDSTDACCALYFGDPAPLTNRLKGDLGLAGYQAFILNKEPTGAIPLFKQKREDESQRKVGAGIYYEVGNGNYGEIPPALGKGNKTLKTYVQSALKSYDDDWWWNKSDEEAPVIEILKSVLDDHPRLFWVVLWYIDLNALPCKSPATVKVGQKLQTNSLLRRLLRAEYAGWV